MVTSTKTSVPTVTETQPVPPPTKTATLTQPNTSTPAPTKTEAATDEVGPIEEQACVIGLGLRVETVDFLMQNRDYNGMVMTGSSNMAESYFPELPGWTRIIGAPSLETLESKAARAQENNTPYEVLAYGLETSETTPDSEWTNLNEAMVQFNAIASRYNKITLTGPGFRLMSDNPEKYPEMAARSDIWLLQTQVLQKNSPGQAYRQEVEKLIAEINNGNPDIKVWAQIVFLRDQDPDPTEWLAYYQAIQDLVDGAYIGIYSWNTENTEKLNLAIEDIFSATCKKY